MPVHLNVGKRSRERQSGLGDARITRRCFLAACVAGCTRVNRSESFTRPHETTWALLSDPHIHSARDAQIRGACMADNLRAVVEDVISLRPDHVLINGDVAFAEGLPADYAAFQDIISPLHRYAAASHAGRPR